MRGEAVIALSIVLLASAAQAGTETTDLVKPEVAAQHLIACGFSKTHPRFDKTLQEEIVEVEDAAATDEQLACAARVSLSAVNYIYFPEALQKRYDAIYWPLAQQQDTASARQWLAERGMLDRLPKYDGHDTAFAKQLEEFCGEGARGLLESKYGPHAIDQDWIMHKVTPSTSNLNEFRQSGEIIHCLDRAGAAAGFPVGFVGNAKASPSK